MDKTKLMECRKLLKECFLLEAQYNLISEQTQRINKNKWAKNGFNLNSWNSYSKEQQDLILNMEVETDEKIKLKYGFDSSEAYQLWSNAKTLFNNEALIFSVSIAITQEQKNALSELINLSDSKKLIYQTKIFNITSKLDLFLEGITTEECLKMVA